MLLPVISLLCAALGFTQPQQFQPSLILRDPATGKQSGFIEARNEPLSEHPQMSPKMFGGERWRFDWETIAYESLIPGGNSLPRFLVFSQERAPSDDTALSVAHMLERLWEYLYGSLKMDHDDMFSKGVVYVYLCKGGEPGGEQLFGDDSVNGNRQKVNTIYFYDLPSFKDPVEMAREVAHEYGHATLAGVNGYSEPEDWANGFLGEKVYLKHMDDAMAAKAIDPSDVMGVTKPQLDQWVAKNVTPLVELGSTIGPNAALLKARDKQGMDNFLGLALYIDSLFPATIFSKSLQLIPSSNAEDYLEALPIAVAQPNAYNLKIPSYLVGKNIWVPIGNSKIRGASVVARRPDWVKIVAASTPVEILSSTD